MSGWHGLDRTYELHSRSVYRRALQLLADPEEARDATQEVFVRVMGAGGVSADPTSTVWLYRVTTNLCLNRLRDRSRQEALLASKYSVDMEVRAAGETRAIVAQVLARVPEELQDVAIYFFVDGLTYDEIAPMLGVSRRTVSNRLSEFRDLMTRLFPQTRSAS